MERNMVQLKENPGLYQKILDTRTLSDRIYQLLVDRILSGEIIYGEKLNIRKIAQMLGVSTMPVREAIRHLAWENVVEIKPRSTCLVKKPTQASMLEAFDMREMIELYSIERIFPTIELEELSDLKRYLKGMDENLPENNEDPKMSVYVKYDQLFHQEFCVLTRNSYLLKTYRTNMLHLNIAMTFYAGVEPNMKQVHADHCTVVQCLAANSMEAVYILKKHLEKCRQNMVQGHLFNSLPYQ